ncbi:GAF domain-containing sensor histidine kinase [Spirochaeta dissipatitropha]
MISAVLSENESERIKKLHSLKILDTLAEQEFDDIVFMVSRICKTPLANISLVDTTRQWYKANIGSSIQETPRDIAFCAHTILESEIMVVEDTLQDERFRDNSLVLSGDKIRFYAGMPLITSEGFALGALCAIDTVPRTFSEDERQTLKVLSRYVTTLLELRYTSEQLQVKNNELQKQNLFKEKLISIIAHDLRSPFTHLQSVCELFETITLTEDEKKYALKELKQIASSSLFLIENLLAWTTMLIQKSGVHPVPSNIHGIIQSVMNELNHLAVKKNNAIILSAPNDNEISIDPNILRFVSRNLLSNAIKFTRSGTITVAWEITDKTEGKTLKFTVEDTGIGFDPDVTRLFSDKKQPSQRGTAGEKGSGLALGFCKDFISQHQGSITVNSKPGEGSTFTVYLPELKKD